MSSIITNISENKLRNEDHVQCHESVNQLIVDKAEETFGLEALRSPYKAQLEEEKVAHNYLKGSKLTVRIVETDRRRDMLFRGCSNQVKSFRDHFDPEVREAANTLWVIFKAYGNLTEKNFDAETTAIDDLQSELKEPEAEAAVKKLGMESWVAELGAENSRVQHLLQERSSAVAQKSAHRMRVARRATDRYYRAIVAALETRALLGSPGETFDSFILDLNAIIARFKNRLAKEYAHRNGDPEEPDGGVSATDGGENGPDSEVES